MVEEVPDREGEAIGGTMIGGGILEDTRDELVEEEVEEGTGPTDSMAEEEDNQPQICIIKANWAQRRRWLRQRIIEDTGEQVWLAAGYTYSQQLAEAAQKQKPQKSFEEMVPKHYQEYYKVFSEHKLERLPAHKPWDHAIEFSPGAPESLRTKIYPMSPVEQEELDRFIDENLRKGYIRPSKSPMASPVFFVKKKDGKLRFVQDYRRLNEFTVKNRTPLPLVSDIVNCLRGAKYFTKFNVRWGYNNVWIKEGDKWKAGFATN